MDQFRQAATRVAALLAATLFATTVVASCGRGIEQDRRQAIHWERQRLSDRVTPLYLQAKSGRRSEVQQAYEHVLGALEDGQTLAQRGGRP